MLPVNQQPVELDDESIMSDMASAHADSDNAFLCLALARELGLPVPDARPLRQEGGAGNCASRVTTVAGMRTGRSATAFPPKTCARRWDSRPHAVMNNRAVRALRH